MVQEIYNRFFSGFLENYILENQMIYKPFKDIHGYLPNTQSEIVLSKRLYLYIEQRKRLLSFIKYDWIPFCELSNYQKGLGYNLTNDDFKYIKERFNVDAKSFYESSKTILSEKMRDAINKSFEVNT